MEKTITNVHQKGFTVVELIVAMAVFTVVVTVAVGVFTSVVRNQRRLSTLMTVNDNAGAVLEQMAREIRTGYRFCEGQNPSVACDATTDALNFTNYAGEAVRYGLSKDKKITRVEGAGMAVPLTANEVEVMDLSFITAQISALPGTNVCAPWRITILVRVRPKGDTDDERETKLQTTISSRVLPVEAPGAPDEILQTCER